jgi:hypothetical protein
MRLQLFWYNKIWNMTNSYGTGYLANKMLSISIYYYASERWSERAWSLVIPCVYRLHLTLSSTNWLIDLNSQLIQNTVSLKSRTGDEWLFLTKAWTLRVLAYCNYKKHAILNGFDSQCDGMPSCLTNRLNKRQLFRHEDQCNSKNRNTHTRKYTPTVPNTTTKISPRQL